MGRYVNKQNIRFCASKNPRLTTANPLDSEKVTVESHVQRYITCDVYLSLLNDEFVLFLMGYGIPMNSAWFQQDDADFMPAMPYFTFFMAVLRRQSC